MAAARAEAASRGEEMRAEQRAAARVAVGRAVVVRAVVEKAVVGAVGARVAAMKVEVAWVAEAMAEVERAAEG